ncbi:Imm32 family immunity protein [Micromonospora profundi]|uniref:Imm32 family immunity protein n=1 Tax=Micromonospora TaxID=1873 RepID=UPI0033B2AA51
MDMQVLRSDATAEMELSGTRLDLLGLAQALRSVRETLPLNAEADPFPYSSALSTIESRCTSGYVAITLSADFRTLTFSGGPGELESLASALIGFAEEGDDSAHLHVEYVPGHEYLSPRSVPLVIALTG